MLSLVFIAQTVQAVSDALRSAGVADEVLAVLDQPRLGRALAERGHRVVQVAARVKPLRRVAGDRVCGEWQALPFGDAGLAAVVALGIGQRDDWAEILASWSHVVRESGAIVMIDRTSGRVPPSELTRRALCSGLAEIEQRQVGRTTVTSGRVRKLD